MRQLRNTSWFAMYLILLVCFSMPIWSQVQDAAAEANAAYQGKNWVTAEKLYSELAHASPTNPRYWYRLGVSARANGHNEQAVDDFKHAQANGLPLALVGFDMACAYAALGQKDKALETLAEAVKQGYGQPDRMSSEPALQPLKGDPRFVELVDRAKRNQKPCVYSAENRQFDFWVGDWDVVDATSGITAGSSRIEKELGECVIWENWTSANTTYAGKSYNVYNPDLKRWEQFWVDNVGGSIHFYGGLKDGVMDFYTDEISQSDGTKLKRHLQFFNLSPDKVRQFSQGSIDGGKTWKVEYDFTYSRRKSASN
jgi:tetratricopeptide (TPR) repeat protein